MITLIADTEITNGQPIAFSYTADERVAGRIRLTSGTELVPFVLELEGREPVAATAHRVRGRSGSFRALQWGEHAVGAELVLRFEGAKVWMKVVA